MRGNWLYPTNESSVIINHASSKKCSDQADLPGSLKPCAETLACEDDKVGCGCYSTLSQCPEQGQ